jgi:hypothetical protein
MEAALVRADGMRQKAELDKQKMDKELKASKGTISHHIELTSTQHSFSLAMLY